MPISGAGVVSKRAASVAVPNTTVQSSPYNLQEDDTVDSLNAMVQLSGLKTMTGDLPMGTKKITGLAVGTALTDAPTLGQSQSQAASKAATVGGTVDAITLVMAPVTLVYTTGDVTRWTSGGVNTITNPTVNRDAIGAKTIKKGASAALAVGDTGVSGYICEAIYDGTDFILQNPAGSTTAATTTQQLTGTSAAAFSTPDSVAALWEAGADITDGAAITIGEGGYFNLITSTTTITSFNITTDKAGRSFRVRFNTIRTLTHNGTTIFLTGQTNITTAVGDIAFVRSLGSGNVVVEAYTRADGKALVVAAAGGITLDTEQATTSGTTKDFTIPAGAKRITVMLDGVSVNGTGVILVQIGDAGGIENTGYVSLSSSIDATVSASAEINSGFGTSPTGSTGFFLTGPMTLTRMNATHTWIATGIFGEASANSTRHMGGSKTLSAELTTVRLTSVGPDTFDAGAVNISYE